MSRHLMAKMRGGAPKVAGERYEVPPEADPRRNRNVLSRARKPSPKEHF